MPSAVNVRAHLPAGLERLRRAHVADDAHGVPAHLTMLYPFIEGADLTSEVRRDLEHVARERHQFDYVLRGSAIWPDTLYVAVEPTRPFVALQAALQAAFPAYPIYGREATFEFVPHVTIVEGPDVDDPAVRTAGAWRALPVPARATAIELIATRPDGVWRLIWRIPLGVASPSAVDRMPA
jgi:2'-5' RNA ligase